MTPSIPSRNQKFPQNAAPQGFQHGAEFQMCRQLLRRLLAPVLSSCPPGALIGPFATLSIPFERSLCGASIDAEEEARAA